MTQKILHIIDSLNLGGAQMSLKYLVENDSDTNFKHYIFPLRNEVEISINCLKIEHDRGYYNPIKLWDIYKVCRREQINIIHTHLKKSAIAGLILSFLLPIKVVVHEHGPDTLKKFPFFVYRTTLRLLQRKVSKVITVSNAIKQLLIDTCKLPENKFTTVYNAINTDKFVFSNTAREKIRKELRIPATDIVIGYCGRLEYIKGSDLLIPIILKLKKLGFNCHLILVGHGSMLETIQKDIIQKQLTGLIHCLGFRSDIADIISSFDIAIQPSRQEAFGISVLEYYSIGVPVICSNAQGLAEIAADQQTALVCTNHDIDKYADKIIAMISDHKLREKLSQNGKIFSRNFSVANFVTDIHKVYLLINQ